MTTDVNSFLCWHERLASPFAYHLDIPMPKTEVFPISDEVERELFAFHDPREEGRGLAHTFQLGEEVERVVDRIGRYPLFMRTAYLADKRQWERSCFVKSPGNFFQNLIHLAGASYKRGQRMEALVLREFIPLVSLFQAFQGLPISTERRYFVRDGVVECHHPRWDEGEIRLPSSSSWRNDLALMNSESDPEIALLTGYAERVGECISRGYWAVDFARAQDGTWYFMGVVSGDGVYHQSDCSFKKSLKKCRKIKVK